MLRLLFILLTLLSLISATKHSVVPNKDALILSDEYDNGYPENKYNEILDKFIEIYTPVIAIKGGTFHILRDFKDGSVNAWAWRLSDEFHLEVPGGMSRYYLISEEGFITTICHELGHLLGGAPLKGSKSHISSEGQSDYFGASHCLKRVLSEITPYKPLKVDPELETVCSDELCKRAMSGMKSINAYYAKIAKVPFPRLSIESTEVARRTKDSHPKPQCRLDTMKRAYLCPVSFKDEVSYEDPKVGSCHLNYFPEFARPACWFKEEQ